MADKITLLEERLDKLLQFVERLKEENAKHRVKNIELQSELSKLRLEVNKLRVQDNDQAQAIKEKLISIGSYVTELEAVVGS